MLLTHGRLLLGARSSIDAARSVEAGTVDDRGVMNDGVVNVRVVDDRRVHMQDSRVVGEVSALPAPAIEAYAAVTESIVNPTVKADVGPPVTGMPGVKAAAPAPVSGSPKKDRPGSHYPDSRNPVVAGITVSPIPRGP